MGAVHIFTLIICTAQFVSIYCHIWASDCEWISGSIPGDCGEHNCPEGKTEITRMTYRQRSYYADFGSQCIFGGAKTLCCPNEFVHGLTKRNCYRVKNTRFTNKCCLQNTTEVGKEEFPEDWLRGITEIKYERICCKDGFLTAKRRQFTRGECLDKRTEE